MKRKAYVVDYGIINLKNIVRGLEKVNADVEICSHPKQLENASSIVVPGVGAFKTGMEELKKRGFDEGLARAVETGLPTLGICLGMQLFMQEGFEHGQSLGLGLIDGAVERIPLLTSDGQKRKVPHIGWTKLVPPDRQEAWKNSCLSSLSSNSFCYFVHSFMARPKKADEILAECMYDELPIVAAIKSNNLTGLQFHPERSGPVGLKILDQFLDEK